MLSFAALTILSTFRQACSSAISSTFLGWSPRSDSSILLWDSILWNSLWALGARRDEEAENGVWKPFLSLFCSVRAKFGQVRISRLEITLCISNGNIFEKDVNILSCNLHPTDLFWFEGTLRKAFWKPVSQKKKLCWCFSPWVRVKVKVKVKVSFILSYPRLETERTLRLGLQVLISFRTLQCASFSLDAFELEFRLQAQTNSEYREPTSQGRRMAETYWRVMQIIYPQFLSLNTHWKLADESLWAP